MIARYTNPLPIRMYVKSAVHTSSSPITVRPGKQVRINSMRMIRVRRADERPLDSGVKIVFLHNTPQFPLSHA